MVGSPASAADSVTLPGGTTPLATFVRGLALLGVSGLASMGGVTWRRPPLSLVQVVWPTLQPVTSEAARPPTWTVPDGGKKTLFFATLVDLRF
jgi:hypothetical protein